MSGHKPAKHPFDSSESLSRPAPSVHGNHVSPQKVFHANNQKISKPEFSFLSAMSNNFQPTIPLKTLHQNHLRPPVRKWTSITSSPVLPNAEVSGPTMFNAVQRRLPFQPTYVDKRPRQIHQRRFQPAIRISNGILSEQGSLASPSIPNVIPHSLPENTAIAHVQKKSSLVQKDISLKTPAKEVKLDDHNVVMGPVQAAVLPLSDDMHTKPIILPLQKPTQEGKAKKLKPQTPRPGIRKAKKKISEQKSKKPLKSKPLKKVQRKKSRSNSKKTEQTTSVPTKQTEPPKTTQAPTTTEETPIDDDFLPGGASGSWEMPDHDFGSQEVNNAFGRERFLPGCMCTMFCGHGYEFAGICGASSAEFFRPRLSKCCPVKNGSGGSSRYMPFFFDD